MLTITSWKDLKVILAATHNNMEELMIKHVNECLCAIMYAIQLGEEIRDVQHLE